MRNIITVFALNQTDTQKISWTVSIANIGVKTAKNVTVYVILPSGIVSRMASPKESIVLGDLESEGQAGFNLVESRGPEVPFRKGGEESGPLKYYSYYFRIAIIRAIPIPEYNDADYAIDQENTHISYARAGRSIMVSFRAVQVNL